MAWKSNQRNIIRLSITIQYVEPKVARKMDVLAATHLDNLHLYIQAAMGWENDHMWGFDAQRHGKRAHWSPEDWDDALDETLLDIIAFLEGKPEVTYVYDYGDYWEHKIRIGTIQPARDDRCYPYLVSGTGHCPLEDIGGASGHAEFLQAFENPNSEYRECFPNLYTGNTTWDPEDADLDARKLCLAQFVK